MKRKLWAIWDLLFTKKEWVLIEYNAENFVINFGEDITTEKIDHVQLLLEFGRVQIADMEKAVDDAKALLN